MSWVNVAIGVVGIGAGLYSSNKANQTAKDANKKALKTQEDILKQTAPYGTNFLQYSKNAAIPSLNYYQSLMSGDKYRTQEALAPELNAIAQKYRGSVSAARGLYPRGGMSAAKASELPLQASGEQANLLMGSRANAADKLSQLSGMYGSLGLNAYGLQSSVGSNLFQSGLQARQDQYARDQQTGAGIYQGLQGIMNGYQNWQAGRTQTQPLPQGRTIGSIYSGAPGAANTGVPSNPYQYGTGNTPGNHGGGV